MEVGVIEVYRGRVFGGSRCRGRVVVGQNVCFRVDRNSQLRQWATAASGSAWTTTRAWGLWLGLRCGGRPSP